jgi:pilus assembly protein Flp/PilA
MLASLLVYLIHYLPQDEKGQGMAEYGLILVLIALAVIAALGFVGDELVTTFDAVVTGLGGAAE